jgi:cytochrome P450
MVGRSAPPVTYPTDRTLFAPSSAFAGIRNSGPIQRLRFSDGVEGWIVTSHELARKALNAQVLALPALGSLAEGATISVEDSVPPPGTFLLADPPLHTEYRRRFAGKLSATNVKLLAGNVEQIVAEQLDLVEAAGHPVDLVQTYALPIPLRAICSILGVPYDHVWHRRVQLLNAENATHQDFAIADGEMYAEMARQVEAKRARPDDGLLSYIVNDAGLSEEEAVGTGAFLVHAGHDMTSNTLALSIALLVENRDWWDALITRPEMLGDIVEELIRFLTVLNHGLVARVAREDVTIGGVTIAVGERVQISHAAANRDPAAFERPDEFDPERPPWGHLAFGYGIHQCIGQHVARLELKVALTRLRERFPTLRLAVPSENLRFFPGTSQVHGLYELPVEWEG